MAISPKIPRYDMAPESLRRGANAAEVTIGLAVLGLVVLLALRAC